MSYTPPTYADFIARFPIFSNTVLYSQVVVEAILVEATNQIDTTWREIDYAPAIMYLAAHMLATDNSSAGTEIDYGTGPTSIASESFSGMSIAYKTVTPMAGSAAASAFGTTSYGRRYYDLLKKNKPAVVVA